MDYSVSTELYHATAVRLLEAIGPAGYFSGSLTFDFDGVECRLTTSVMVYRRAERYPEGPCDAVADLVPVWWEFHTCRDGVEMLNDFSFATLRDLLRASAL